MGEIFLVVDTRTVLKLVLVGVFGLVAAWQWRSRQWPPTSRQALAYLVIVLGLYIVQLSHLGDI